MPTHLTLHLRTDDPTNAFTAIIKTYDDLLDAGRYGQKRCRYLASVVHFGQWLDGEGLEPSDVDAALIGQFLSKHLPQCTCPRPVPLRLIEVRAALHLLLGLLQTLGIAPLPSSDDIARELACFDAKMREVWGLSKGTRDHRCRMIRRLLKRQFGIDRIDLTQLSPSIIRAFVLGDADWSTSTIRVMGGAVRCYLRHRKLLGDDVHDLLRAVPRPAYWRDAALPEALSPDELNQLLHAFDAPCPSRRRGYAIVRCLADLGLRSSEIISLRLEDISWQEGTLRVAAGKARRADVLPLPHETGVAIANYLLHERPTSSRREVFVRHVAPLGEPVGRRVVQQTVHAAYRRLGWDRTRVHILRHTLGSRLVNAGTPMKQIADLLRHRSIVTSAIYSRVDAARLSAVALPWPGYEA